MMKQETRRDIYTSTVAQSNTLILVKDCDSIQRIIYSQGSEEPSELSRNDLRP